MAKLIKSPLSKLTILFLFLFFIPGLVLSYLSIQNIANQKVLTEKRLIEEQNDLATNLVRQFEKRLYEYAVTFYQMIDSLDTELPAGIFVLNSFDFVSLTRSSNATCLAGRHREKMPILPGGFALICLARIPSATINRL